MREYRYTTPHGIEVTRSASQGNYQKGLKHLLHDLDRHRGIYLSSGYEYPGRYSRWDIASTCPPLEIVSYDRRVEFRPLNERGRRILEILYPVLAPHPHWEEFVSVGGALEGRLKPLPALFPEEERSKQPSAFSILRALTEEFRGEENSRLGLVGAFGYDLLFQFEPIEKKLARHGHKDLHLFLCDDIWFMDRMKEKVERFRYDFRCGEISTAGVPRDAERIKPPKRVQPGPIVSDHTPEEYMASVEAVREGMRRGDYYEVVLRQTFSTPYSGKASELFERVQKASPSPYEFLLQFGEEQLVGASPEMFVRVEGRRIETSPISGTAQRTGDPMRDADNIKELLKSLKEESELTMCTDVDRNDKSRVCVPGSVRVIGRRLIESYAGVVLANLNCPAQIVISGPSEKMVPACALAKAKGAMRAVPLPVAGAYHSPLMASAQPRLEAELARVVINPPSIPVIANVTAQPHGGPGTIRARLVEQVTSSVRWEESMRYLVGQGFTRFIELGPGRTLSGFMKRISKTAQILNVEDLSSLEATAKALAV